MYAWLQDSILILSHICLWLQDSELGEEEIAKLRKQARDILDENDDDSDDEFTDDEEVRVYGCGLEKGKVSFGSGEGRQSGR